MFETLAEQPADKILALMGQYRADPREGKIDLGVGVYKDATGHTPVMRAVKAAEKLLWEAETTKTYTGLAGEPAFHAAMSDLVLGDAVAADRVAAAATPGGTGAVRQALEMVQMAAPEATVWVSDPTWPNHLSILKHLKMKVRMYRYFDGESRGFDAGGMMADLAGVQAGDVVLLHGCCHNPTGIDPDAGQFAALGDLCAARGLLPLVDLAYQGFGCGLEADAAGLRGLARTCPELLVAVSASKTFGGYRDRAGALLGLAQGPAAARRLQGRLVALNRLTISFPPDHGARVVQTVLDDPALRALWMAELDAMRARIAALRAGLAAALATGPIDPTGDRPGPIPVATIARQRGMFSCLPLSPDQMDRLRIDHGVYATRDGRINIAGLTEATIPALAARIAAVR